MLRLLAHVVAVDAADVVVRAPEVALDGLTGGGGASNNDNNNTNSKNNSTYNYNVKYNNNKTNV